MTKFIIEGKKKLKGEVTISGSKHAAISMIIGALLTDAPVRLGGIPNILDVESAIAYAQELGATIRRTKRHEITIHRHPLTLLTKRETAHKFRFSLLAMGVLLTRTGWANTSLPGGCKLGQRLCNFSIDGFRTMGATIREEGDSLAGYVGLHGGVIELPYPSVSATLSLACAASLAKGLTIIRNCAINPEVEDFMRFLKRMGAKAWKTNERTWQIRGVEELHGADYHIMSDRIEAVTFMIAAAIAGGDITLIGVNPQHLWAEIMRLRKIGVKITQVTEGLRVQSESCYFPAIVETIPYPGFHTDIQPLIAALLATVLGRSRVIERINNDRFGYAKELCKMGANIKIITEKQLCPNGKCGQSIFIDGVKSLHGAYVKALDLRGGAALVLAALGAEGQTVINNVEQIDRGYERLDEKLRSLGADIRRG